MARIINTAAVEVLMGRWHPSDFAFVERLEYVCGGENRGAHVIVVGIMQRRDESGGSWPLESLHQIRITMLFDGVRDLELRRFGQSPKQISGFDIVDISDRGLEGIAFSVEDYENGELQFMC